ncbi:MAG: DUF4270 family protein [Ichthyobacteriaceae bacterium]|nr:DUF4270 family protein [Ichthyobacteriaceae bacterium]
MGKHALKLFLSLYLSISFTSCTKNANSIGNNLIDGNELVGDTYIDRSVTAFNVVDSVVTSKLAFALVGAYNDATFGVIKNSFAIEPNLPISGFDFGSSAKVDSVVLTLPYLGRNQIVDSGDSTITVANFNTDSIYGGINNMKLPINLKISLLDKTIDDNTVYYSNEEFVLGQELYSTENFAPLSNAKTDGSLIKLEESKFRVPFTYFNTQTNREEKDSIPNVRFKLNTNFFQDLVDDDYNYFNSNSDLLTKFKGLVLSTESSDGSVYSFNMTDKASVVIYYKNNADKKVKKYTFNFSNESDIINSYKFIRTTSGTDLDRAITKPDSIKGEEKLYIQGMAGVGVGIKLFNKENLIDSLTKNNWLINQATLKISIADKNIDVNSLPQSLSLRTFNDGLVLMDELAEQYSFGGILDKDEMCYKFRITRYIHQVINNKYTNYKLLLESKSPNSSFDKVIVNGNKSAKNPLVLEIKYTEVK